VDFWGFLNSPGTDSKVMIDGIAGGYVKSNSVSTVSAIDFVRMNRGKSQTALVEASDHHQYVVKWMNGARSTICVRMEALRNSIYQLMGLPVSSWTTIEIPDELIEAYPEMRLTSALGRVRPAAGIHFGSRVVCDPPLRSYETLPAELYSRVRNRSDFWGAYALDVWTERYDDRQAVFAHGEDSLDLMAVFIDHGNSVRSLEPTVRPSFASCLFPDRRIYLEHEMMDVVEEWIARIQQHGQTAIATAYAQLPADWKTASVEALSHQFIRRIADLPEVIFPSISAARPQQVFAKPAARVSAEVQHRARQVA
jgi:hypothetical protein